jgi:histidine ammonia-lyase
VRELVKPLEQDRVLSTDILVLADAIARGHFTSSV